MHNLQNLKPSVVLPSLISSAKLTNSVSANALRDANVTWCKHISQTTLYRDQQTLLIVADQLRLIITQVVARRCRVNPTQWPILVKLENDLRIAHLQQLNLEPYFADIAVNDDHSEVA